MTDPRPNSIAVKTVKSGLKQSLLMALSAAAATLTAIYLSTSAHARTPVSNDDAFTATIGAGAIYTPDYEGSDDFDIMPFPYLSVGYKDLAYIRGPEAGINVLRLKPSDTTKILVGPIARYRRDRPQKRNRDLAGLGNVDTSIEVGGSARVEIGRGWMQISYAKDVAGGHEGWVGTAEAGYSIPLSDNFTASINGTTSWVDQKYMRTYFGVTSAQSLRSGLPQFDAGKGIKDAGGGLNLQYRLGDHWTIAAVGSYSRLLNDAKRAPLVRLRGSASQWQGGAFLAYRF